MDGAARYWLQQAHYVLARLEADVFPEIGHQPLEDLQASAFRDAVLKIERRGALDIAKRVLQTCGQIMRYAVAHDFASHNPVAGVKPSDILNPHKRRNFPRVDVKELPVCYTPSTTTLEPRTRDWRCSSCADLRADIGVDWRASRRSSTAGRPHASKQTRARIRSDP